jgi:hypothetical protein
MMNIQYCVHFMINHTDIEGSDALTLCAYKLLLMQYAVCSQFPLVLMKDKLVDCGSLWLLNE